jgi:hypothetical protein
MTFDYGSECPLSCVRLRGGQVKLFNLRAKLFNLRQNAYAIAQHCPEQHVVCLHHFDRAIKFDRNLDGRTRRETTAKGDIAFLPADAPIMLRPAPREVERLERTATDDLDRVLSFSYLVLEPSYLAELALTNGIGRPLDFIPTFATPDPFLHEITAALTSAPRIKDRQRTSLRRPCSMRRVREFCATTPKSDTCFPVHHDSPTINCVQRSITSMTISENLSSCVRFLELPA